MCQGKTGMVSVQEDKLFGSVDKSHGCLFKYNRNLNKRDYTKKL